MRIRLLTPVVACVCLLPLSTFAQRPTPSLEGVVSMPSGERIAGAPIAITDRATGAVARASSDENGHYEMARLPAGVYQVSVTMPCCGFKRFLSEVTIEAGRTAQFDIAIEQTINGQTLGDDPGRNAALMRKRAVVPKGGAPRLGSHTDLSGVWVITGDAYPEPPPALPWAAAIIAERTNNNAKDSPHTRCLPGSPPAPGASSPFIAKFVQTPSLLVMLFEDAGGFRQIFLDGRGHPADLNPTWLGHSTGRWEGDTLVVDTVGFNDRSWIGPNAGIAPHTEALRMTERYRRTDYGHIAVTVTFDDPRTFSKPWTLHPMWDLVPQEELLEFLCENNKPEHLVGN